MSHWLSPSLQEYSRLHDNAAINIPCAQGQKHLYVAVSGTKTKNTSNCKMDDIANGIGSEE